jgi:hypothetical protein
MGAMTGKAKATLIGSAITQAGTVALALFALLAPDSDARVDSTWSEFIRPALVRAGERLDELEDQVVDLRIDAATMRAERDAFRRAVKRVKSLRDADAGAIADAVAGAAVEPVEVERKTAPRRKPLARVRLPVRLE